MANVKFILRDPKSDTPQSLYLRYRITPTIDLKYPINIRVNPKHWNKQTERVKNVIEVKERHQINAFLTELVQAVESFKNEATIRKELVTRQSLRRFPLSSN
jgi:hypothetical protein